MAGHQDSDESSSLIDQTSVGEEERLGVDEMLKRCSGEFGPWQLRHFSLVSLAWALDAFHTMVTLFADREPAWRFVDGPGRTGSGEVCGLRPGSWEWVEGSGASTVAEWGLVCGEKYKVGLVQSAFFAGCMVGCGIFGHLSDSFLGRKGALTAGCIINVLLGCLTALSPSYAAYLVLRTLTGLFTGPMGTTAFVLATEPVGPSRRAAAGMSVFYFFSAGIIVLAAVAAALPSSWRALYVASSLPTLAFVIFILPSLSESPRWYLIRRKPHEALEVMRAITKANGRTLAENASLVLDDEQDVSSSILDAIRLPLTRWRLFLSVAISFFCSIVYYGLTLNVTNLDTNLYLSVIINSASELPAFTLATFLIQRIGRRPLAIGTMWFSGTFCIAAALMGGGSGMLSLARMVCGVLGIFAIAATYNLLLVYTAELFPTTVRSAALGCVQQAEQVGAVVAPLVVVLGKSLPFAVFGACAMVGGVLSFYLPETSNMPLYDTIAGMEQGKSQRGGEASCGAVP